MRHGAKVKQCGKEGCTNYAQKGGVCIRHGAKVKLCSKEGCTNHALKGGVCLRHGAKVKIKLCSQEGCTNKVKKGGVCRRHGAYRNTNDESTAFGSELEQTAAARSQPSERASSSLSIIKKDAVQGVPGEVAILCHEIFEV